MGGCIWFWRSKSIENYLSNKFIETKKNINIKGDIGGKYTFSAGRKHLAA